MFIPHSAMMDAAAKFGGCTLGVSVGCLLGMAPLFFIDGHKGKDGQPSLRAH